MPLYKWIIRCPSCSNAFGLGLIAYKLKRGQSARAIPPNFYVPMGDMGWVSLMPERYKHGEPANSREVAPGNASSTWDGTLQENDGSEP
jgi:hypothetical protein